MPNLTPGPVLQLACRLRNGRLALFDREEEGVREGNWEERRKIQLVDVGEQCREKQAQIALQRLRTDGPEGTIVVSWDASSPKQQGAGPPCLPRLIFWLPHTM